MRVAEGGDAVGLCEADGGERGVGGGEDVRCAAFEVEEAGVDVEFCEAGGSAYALEVVLV